MKHIFLFIAIIYILLLSTLISNAIPVDSRLTDVTSVEAGSLTNLNYDMQAESSSIWSKTTATMKKGLKSLFKSTQMAHPNKSRVNPWITKEDTFEKTLDRLSRELASLSMREVSVHSLIEPYVKECITICAKSIHSFMTSNAIQNMVNVVWEETHANPSKNEEFQYEKNPEIDPNFDVFIHKYYHPLVAELEKLGNSDDKDRMSKLEEFESFIDQNPKSNVWIPQVLPILSEVILMFGQLSRSATRGYVLDHLEEYSSTFLEFGRVFFPEELQEKLESFITSQTGKQFLESKAIRSRLAGKMKMEEIIPELQHPVIPLIKYLSHMALVILSSKASTEIERNTAGNIQMREISAERAMSIEVGLEAMKKSMNAVKELTSDDIKKKLSQMSSSSSPSVTNVILPIMLMGLKNPERICGMLSNTKREDLDIRRIINELKEEGSVFSTIESENEDEIKLQEAYNSGQIELVRIFVPEFLKMLNFARSSPDFYQPVAAVELRPSGESPLAQSAIVGTGFKVESSFLSSPSEPFEIPVTSGSPDCQKLLQI